MGKKAGNLAYLGGKNTLPIQMTTLNQKRKLYHQGDGQPCWQRACLLRQLSLGSNPDIYQTYNTGNISKGVANTLKSAKKIFKKKFHQFFLQLTSKPLPPLSLFSVVISQPVHCKKGQRFSRPQPGCHLPKSPRTGIIKLFPAREGLVSDIPAGDRKTANFLYSVLGPEILVVISRE